MVKDPIPVDGWEELVSFWLGMPRIPLSGPAGYVNLNDVAEEDMGIMPLPVASE